MTEYLKIIYHSEQLSTTTKRTPRTVQEYKYILLDSVKVEVSIYFRTMGDLYNYQLFNIKDFNTKKEKPTKRTIYKNDIGHIFHDTKPSDFENFYIKSYQEGRNWGEYKFIELIHKTELYKDLIKIKIEFYKKNLESMYILTIRRDGSINDYYLIHYRKFEEEAKVYIIELIYKLCMADIIDINDIIRADNENLINHYDKLNKIIIDYKEDLNKLLSRNHILNRPHTDKKYLDEIKKLVINSDSDDSEEEIIPIISLKNIYH